MKQLITLLIICFSQFVVQAQFFNNSIIKTRPFQDFVAFNPTIGFEKPVQKRLSIETGFMYRNRNWHGSGAEWDFGRFHNGTGFRIMIGSKVYFGKTNKHLNPETQKAPFGWLATIQLAQSNSKTNNIEKKHFTGGYENTVNVEINWSEFIVGIGRQFYLFKTVSFEFYFGTSNYFNYEKVTTIVDSENLVEIGTTETLRFAWGILIQPYLTLTVGYYFK